LIIAAALSTAATGINFASDELSVEDRQTRLDMELAVVVVKAFEERSGSHPGTGGEVVRLDSIAELGKAPFDGSFKERDPWGNPYLYLSDEYTFALLSSGQDGRLDLDYTQSSMQEWDDARGDDFVLSAGDWVRRPLSQKERQLRTMADLRSIATAIEEFSIDNNFYPTATSIAELEPQISPVYIRALPFLDGWGNAFVVQAEQASYSLRSLGRDGLPDEERRRGATHTYESDLIFEMGSFTQWPEGKQD